MHPMMEVLTQMIPYNATLGMIPVEANDSRVVLELPDREAHQNHLGGPHAAVQYALAEAASAGMLMCGLGDAFALARPVVKTAQAAYKTFVRGPIEAMATLPPETRERLLAELDSTGKALATVRVEVRAKGREACNEFIFSWAFRKRA